MEIPAERKGQIEKPSGKQFVIAIDGLSGSGKSSTARAVARELDLFHLDTGAMYRAITLLALRKGIPSGNFASMEGLMCALTMEITDQGLLTVDGEDLSHAIRSPEVGNSVSDYSKVPIVRKVLADLQRCLGLSRPSVVEGRDIGTVVFPDADFKFFLTARPEIRARRRKRQLTNLCIESSLDEIAGNLADRDKKDSSRSLSPLAKAMDAVEIDTSDLTLEQQVAIITDLVKNQGEVDLSPNVR